MHFFINKLIINFSKIFEMIFANSSWVQIEFEKPEPVATYTCPSSKMEGNDHRFCIDGIWNGTIPRCGNKTFKSNYHDD